MDMIINGSDNWIQRRYITFATPTNFLFPQSAAISLTRGVFNTFLNTQDDGESLFRKLLSWWPFGNKFRKQQDEQRASTGSSITFKAAGYCIGKNLRSIPDTHDKDEQFNTLYDCGEDSFFADNKSGSFGVADGVGGWSKRGVDPGEIARKLMSNSQQVIASGQRDPYTALGAAYKHIIDNKQVKAGSSTACLLTIKDDKLMTANLGDSGFIILRPPSISGQEYEVVYKSPEQQLHFNCPKQLAVVPDHLSSRNFIKSNPSEADKGQFSVIDGDIIIAGTDGLFDNLYEHEIAEEVTLAAGYLKRNDTQYEAEIARRLVLRARRVSRDKSVRTPFSDNSTRNGSYHLGGKTDDITCVAARVSAKK